MSTTRPFAVLIGGAVGGVAAVLAYGVLAPTSGSEAIASVSSVSPAASVVFEPCVAPAKLEGDTCVTRVTVTKTVPVYAAPAATHKAVPVVAKHATAVSKPTATATATHHEDSEHEDSEHEDSAHEDSTHEDGGSENDNH